MSAPRLYKVLTPTGHAPFVSGYQWSLPTCADGVWTPGAWHEESTDGAALCGKGLHVTAFPLRWLQNKGDVVWHVEAEGLVGDSFGDKVIAARVRILRPLTAEELARLPEDARVLEDQRRAAEKRRRLSEMAKRGAETAARQREEIAAARDAGVKSPALFAFEMLALSLRFYDRRVRDAGPCEVGCSTCGGSGQGWHGENSTCRTCGGAGVVTSQVLA